MGTAETEQDAERRYHFEKGMVDLYRQHHRLTMGLLSVFVLASVFIASELGRLREKVERPSPPVAAQNELDPQLNLERLIAALAAFTDERIEAHKQPPKTSTGTP